MLCLDCTCTGITGSLFSCSIYNVSFLNLIIPFVETQVSKFKMEIKILKSTNVLQCIYINAIRTHRNLDFVSFLITLENKCKNDGNFKLFKGKHRP